jgi:pimeloyl-ACP methyl ester carboxylesterase
MARIHSSPRRIEPEETSMLVFESSDGTKIVYDRQGEGPALLLVDGALCTRNTGSKPELARLLASHFTVYSYDRRGRGDSGDTLPYAVQREIEDIEALIELAGGTASLYGHSSGASLALEATVELGNKVEKLAMYEAPYNDDPVARRAWGVYISQLTEALAEGRRGDAVALFMAYVDTPDEQIDGMRQMPFWPDMEAVGPTLAYDHTALLGQENSVPTDRAARVDVPTLVMYGDACFPFMRETAQTLAQLITDAELRNLEDQTHGVSPEVLAPVLVEFLRR